MFNPEKPVRTRDGRLYDAWRNSDGSISVLKQYGNWFAHIDYQKDGRRYLDRDSYYDDLINIEEADG